MATSTGQSPSCSAILHLPDALDDCIGLLFGFPTSPKSLECCFSARVRVPTDSVSLYANLPALVT